MPASPPIVLATFSGEQPRIIPRLMPDSAAQEARETRLDDGGLLSIRESIPHASAGNAQRQTIFRWLGQWLAWDTVVHAVEGPVAKTRLYYTGDGKPKVRIEANDSGAGVPAAMTIYDLAVPRPANIKGSITTAVSGVATGQEVFTRAYIYTYVTAYGEESEPSVSSVPCEWKQGQTVTVAGILSDTTRAITTQRFYRLQTGTQGTTYYFIAERVVSAGNFVDTVAFDAIAEPCPTIDNQSPPDDLEGLIALPNGIMAAFKGKQLYFSEPWQPHAWPERYALTVDRPIMGLGAIGQSLVVTTDANPYLATGTTPAAMALQKLEHSLPCINKRSVVDLGYAIAYASHDGLVVMRGDAAPSLATANIFTPEDWQRLSPETMVGTMLHGRYVGFYDTIGEDQQPIFGALFIDLGAQSFLFRSATRAQAVYFELQSGKLFYVDTGTAQIMEFDAKHAARRMLYWKSKEFVLPYPENYGAFRVDTIDDLTPIDADAETAERDAAILRNQAKIDAGSILGEINATAIGTIPWVPPPAGVVSVVPEGNTCNTVPVNGDILEPMPVPPGKSITCSIWANKRIVASVNVSNEPVRLPSGFLARTWEIDCFTNSRVYRITMAKNMDDLKRTP